MRCAPCEATRTGKRCQSSMEKPGPSGTLRRCRGAGAGAGTGAGGWEEDEDEAAEN
jgi:hypothetical protein